MDSQDFTKSPLHKRIKRNQLLLLITVLMPFGLFNGLDIFQICMMNIFSNFVEKCIEVFMDD